ncbi:hypothetical protein SOVF_072820 isoform A [Spinacia oleracea]|nr:hypothetical protein SOVF_072820 isoform A [Spinacia oleracea]
MIVGGTEAAIYASYCHGCCIRDGVPVPTLSHRRKSWKLVMTYNLK